MTGTGIDEERNPESEMADDDLGVSEEGSSEGEGK